MTMLDNNANGKVDRVTVTFSEAIASSTNTAQWTLASVPSSGTLSSVSTSGSTATLTLSEGATAADTSVGGFTVALATNAAGIRDTTGNLSSFAAAAPADGAAPVKTAMTMLDNNDNGKVDRVTVTFSETLASSTNTAQWTLANVPSGGTLASVSTSGNTATLVLNEGAAAADTTVGSFTVALATNAAGIRDTAGNLSSFAATAPSDGAGPALLSISTTTGGSTSGKMETGDTIAFTFSEPLKVSTVPASVTVTESRSGQSTLGITSGIISGDSVGISNNYLTTNNASATAPGTVTLTNSNKTIQIVLGTVTGGGAATATAGVTMSPNSNLTDTANNSAAGSATVTPLF